MIGALLTCDTYFAQSVLSTRAKAMQRIPVGCVGHALNMFQHFAGGIRVLGVTNRPPVSYQGATIGTSELVQTFPRALLHN